jgi:hypothetical protein
MLDRKRLSIATSLLAGGLLVFRFSSPYLPQFTVRYHSLLAGLVGVVRGAYRRGPKLEETYAAMNVGSPSIRPVRRLDCPQLM